MFRLDRVLAIEPRDQTFVRPLDFDPAEYVLHSLATLPYGVEVEVELELSVDEARRRLPPDTGTLDPIKGGVRLRCQADNLNWMARTLIHIGCGFRVVRPPELRETLRMTARDVVRMARRGARQSSKKTKSPVRITAPAPAPAYVA